MGRRRPASLLSSIGTWPALLHPLGGSWIAGCTGNARSALEGGGGHSFLLLDWAHLPGRSRASFWVGMRSLLGAGGPGSGLFCHCLFLQFFLVEVVRSVKVAWDPLVGLSWPGTVGFCDSSPWHSGWYDV